MPPRIASVGDARRSTALLLHRQQRALTISSALVVGISPTALLVVMTLVAVQTFKTLREVFCSIVLTYSQSESQALLHMHEVKGLRTRKADVHGSSSQMGQRCFTFVAPMAKLLTLLHLERREYLNVR